MELYYLLVQRSVWTVHLLTIFLISSEGRHYRRNSGWKVTSPPEILPDVHNVTVHTNDRAVLKCTVRNRRTKDVQWRIVHKRYPLTIGTETWTSDKDISVLYTKYNQTDEGWDLVIRRATPRHTNIYECQISSTESNRRYVYLEVKAKPKKDVPAITLTGTAYLDLYQRVNLTCNATGTIRAPEDVDWFHNGNIIDPHDERWGGRLRIYKHIPMVPGRWLISELIIDKSTLSDQGIYVCRSSENKADSYPVSILDTSGREDDERIFFRDDSPNKTKRYGLDKLPKDKDVKDKSCGALNTTNFLLLTILFILANS